jgi:hypothetical protein
MKVIIDFAKVTRLEVIDENGRVYARYNCVVEPGVQDQERTLKLFVKPSPVRTTDPFSPERIAIRRLERKSRRAAKA